VTLKKRLGILFPTLNDPLAPAMTRNRFKSRMQLLKIIPARIGTRGLRG
jgi:hypothetical protein